MSNKTNYNYNRHYKYELFHMYYLKINVITDISYVATSFQRPFKNISQ